MPHFVLESALPSHPVEFMIPIHYIKCKSSSGAGQGFRLNANSFLTQDVKHKLGWPVVLVNSLASLERASNGLFLGLPLLLHHCRSTPDASSCVHNSQGSKLSRPDHGILRHVLERQLRRPRSFPEAIWCSNWRSKDSLCH